MYLDLSVRDRDKTDIFVDFIRGLVVFGSLHTVDLEREEELGKGKRKERKEIR